MHNCGCTTDDNFQLFLTPKSLTRNQFSCSENAQKLINSRIPKISWGGPPNPRSKGRKGGESEWNWEGKETGVAKERKGWILVITTNEDRINWINNESTKLIDLPRCFVNYVLFEIADDRILCATMAWLLNNWSVYCMCFVRKTVYKISSTSSMCIYNLNWLNASWTFQVLITTGLISSHSDTSVVIDRCLSIPLGSVRWWL